MKSPNKLESRETWLREATKLIRPHFVVCGFPIPENIRFAIAFPSTGRKGQRVGELWHSTTSDDGHFELIVRADVADPVEVLGILTHELIHAVLPMDAGHGKLYKAAAIKIGLQGKMMHAMPGPLLTPRLAEIAEALGPLPHARLNIDRAGPIRAKARRTGPKSRERVCSRPCAKALALAVTRSA